MRCQFIHQTELTPVPEVESVFTTPADVVAQAGTAGGFGNRQTEQALDTPTVSFRDVLVHDVNVSIQEYQKKMKMYQKMVTKRTHQEVICPPEI